MFQNNPLLAQLKQQLHQAIPRIEGTVKAHEKGFGFLELDNKKNYFIPVSKMKNLLPGDRVAGILEDRGDKQQFNPETVIESVLNRFIARVDFIDNSLVIYPCYPNINIAIKANVNQAIDHEWQSGDWVVAKLISHPLKDNHSYFLAEITEFITTVDDPLAMWLITLARHQLPMSAPEYTKPLVISNSDIRQDLTHLDFFTIDSKQTQDMDDAIYLQTQANGNFELTVAIADPSAYVLPDSDLDVIARQRLFTTYLPDFTVPMLPAEIVEDLCSLKLNETRPAVICHLIVDIEGNIIGSPNFSTAWIQSKAKLDYATVSDYLEDKITSEPAQPTIIHQLHLLAKLAKSRINWRQNFALLFDDKKDYRFILNDNKQVIDIIKEEHRIANQMVEEAMILANQAFAHYLKLQLGFAVFNTHTGFITKYLDNVIKLLNDNGITEFDKERLMTLEGYRALRQKINEKPYIKTKILRYHSPAEYALDMVPHFGLGFELYATWTSPLRKYSDLINHRLLKSSIQQQYSEKPDVAILKNLSDQRKLQRLAERDLTNHLYCQYLANHLNNKYQAQVLDINKGGAKVRLVDNGAYAFLPTSLIHAKREEVEINLEEGYIKVKQQLIFSITDLISVTLHEVKIENQKIIVSYQLPPITE
jgi:exoribonuclease II